MFEKLIENNKLGGINCLIWKQGEIVLQKSYGYKNLDTQELMPLDALFRISSMTKPITSVLAMMLYEEQKLDLHDPITKWLPAFEEMKVLVKQPDEYEPANKQITILDLLTHRAGFTHSEFQQGKLREDYRALGGDIDSTLSNEQWIQALANLPLVNQPGELFHYGRSTDLLGILISTIAGKPLGEVMEEKIFAPLGMTDTFFDVPPSKKDRCVSNFGYDHLGALTTLETVPLQMAYQERPDHLAYQSGGQGLWSTLSDYLKFARIFIENGSSGGIRILAPKSMALICSNQLTASQRASSQIMGASLFQENYGFGLGLAMVCKENNEDTIPCAGAIGTVGWPGAYGGWWSADPINRSIALFLTHSMTTPSQLEEGIGFELYEAIAIFSNYCKGLYGN